MTGLPTTMTLDIVALGACPVVDPGELDPAIA